MIDQLFNSYFFLQTFCFALHANIFRPSKIYALILCWYIFLYNSKHSESYRLQGLLYTFQLLPAICNTKMGVGKKLLCSRFELLTISYFVSHFNFVSKDNYFFKKDDVYIGCSLPLFAPLSLPSFPITTVEIPCSSTWCLFCFVK